MKIEREKAAHRSARKNEDEKDVKQTKSTDPKKIDFKTLLARKTGASSQAKSPVKKRGEFGVKLRDGRVQVSEQAEASSRTRTERQVGEVREEQRIEQRHGKGHENRVGREAGDGERTQKSRQIGNVIDKQIQQKVSQKTEGEVSEKKEGRLSRAGQNLGSHKDGPNKMGLSGPAAQKVGASLSGVSAESAESAGMASSAEASGTAESVPHAELRSEKAASRSSHRAEQREQVEKIARALVDKAHIGTDISGRQIVMMELEVPGRGQIRVRLRRRGEGFELRMRPQNQELARDLRQDRGHFRQAAAKRGVTFSSIEIV